MIVKLLPLLLLTLKTSRCSLIMDKAYQKGIHVSDYCPNMKFCREGAHTMCVYYDPNNVMGPRCHNSANVTITAGLANQLLDITNTIRSKIARGVETGKDQVLLPRGYGIFRLKWDNELATFAQVLANQCMLRHDMCRATKRFPHPSQAISIVRFRHPNWEPLNQSLKPTKGLTYEKLVYAITHSFRNWYSHKSAVTEHMVQTYPDWSAEPYKATGNQMGRLYLDMIHGPATHMGCGMSGYSEYVHLENNLQGIQNSLQVICNFSSGARRGTHLYETEPPIPGQGFSAKCGCPPGSKEDADCLCSEATPDTTVLQQPTCPLGETSSYCDPALVLLPIFTIEDAPPEKLYQVAEEIKEPLKNYILQRVDNTSDAVNVQDNVQPVYRVQSSNEMYDMLFNENGAENAMFHQAHKPSSEQSTASPPPPPPYKKNIPSEAIFGFGETRFKQKARARTSQELLEFIREKGKEDALSGPHANKPSAVEIPELSLNKKNNTSETIFGKSRFKQKARARTSQELLELIRGEGKEDGLSWPHSNKPSSVEIPAPSFNKEQQSLPQFRLDPDPKPPSLPPLPPRRPPALRPSPPARPHPRPRPPRTRPRPPPPPPPLPPPPRIPPPPPPRIEQYSKALQTHVNPRPAKSKSRDRNRRPPPKLPPKHHQMKKKASIFTRVEQFQLPERRRASSFKVLKKDVEPRKDFSNLNQVVNDYLKRHPGYRIINGNNEQTQPTKDIKQPAEEKAQTEAVEIDTGLNRVEETVINFNQYLGQKNSSNNNDKDVDIKDDNDNKLLSLLDTLEREVNHIALDGDEKQLFDAKIRKIYGTIVGRTALQMFPKPILFSTPDPEAAEIDFGETKSRDQLEPNQVENDLLKVIDEPKQKKRFKIESQRVEQVKHSSPSVQGHKWKNKFVDSFDQKKYNPDVSNNRDGKPSDRYDHKYNDNHLENAYGDIQHQRMDDLDHKHNENLNRYNENYLDHEYNEVPRKFDEKFDHPHHYDIDRTYNNDEPAARSKMKYQADRHVFREFEHNSLGSHEDITPRNDKNARSDQGPPDIIPLITKDRDKRKKTEKKHKKRVKSLGSRNENDILSLERRKYYQEKLDNIKRKLSGRRNGRKNNPKNERSLRRMQVKNRESSRMRSKNQADQFYMPERARFLHGF